VSLRLLFAALPAVLAPLGVEEEVQAPASDAAAEERGHRSSWYAPAWSPSTAADRFDASGELDGPLPPASERPADLRPVLGMAHGVGPSGLASPWVFSRGHLAASGHPAGRLDLPPPPRD
jgi:hypothetical protein